MKKYILNVMVLLILTGMISCSDFLEKEYDASMSEEKVFGNSTLTRAFLTDIYTNLSDGVGVYGDTQFTGASRDCMTDNAVSFWGLHYYSKIATDSYTSIDHPLLGFWNTNFNGIRKCNMFLANVSDDIISNETISGDDNKLYERFRAEAILLRAMFHLELVAYFGNTIIMCDREAAQGINPVTGQDFGIIFDMDDPAGMNIPRNDAAEVLEWIAQQCDYVKDVLPFRYASEGNWGRMNGATAYALKSRALLYRASALYNESNNTTYWANAAQAAKDFIDKNAASTDPYKLYNDYQQCFYVTPYQNDEVILSRSIWYTTAVNVNLIPYGFSGCAGRTNPTQNFVDAFEMTNGKFIDESGSGYDPQNPYANRDPRLEATIFRHGTVWGRAEYNEQRTVDVSDGGEDYRGDMGGTFTGYYLKKFVNPDMQFSQKSNSPHAWIIYRYAEILLNYAEALNEANGGPTAAAYDAINQVRAREGVNMPALSGLNQASFRKRVRNERRIELSFEDHRFFDLRRWRAYENQTASNETSLPRYEQIYNLYSITITGNGVFNGTQIGTNYKDDNVSTHVFNVPKNYYFPIPNNEVKKAPNLGQNTGW